MGWTQFIRGGGSVPKADDPQLRRQTEDPAWWSDVLSAEKDILAAVKSKGNISSEQAADVAGLLEGIHGSAPIPSPVVGRAFLAVKPWMQSLK
jgi:hypothetical protein